MDRVERAVGIFSEPPTGSWPTHLPRRGGGASGVRPWPRTYAPAVASPQAFTGERGAIPVSTRTTSRAAKSRTVRIDSSE